MRRANDVPRSPRFETVTFSRLQFGHRFRFNYDYCKGCGMCAAECPCGAIRMQPETS